MPARSLFKMATTRLAQHKEGIEDIGEIPYDKIKGVLTKLERPEQLHTIEMNSPHILGQTAEIWTGFLRRDVQGYDNDPIRPKDGKSWYKTYQRALKRAKQQQEEQEMELMARFKEKQDERDRNLATVSDKTVIPGKARHKATQMHHSRSGNPSHLTFAAGSRTKTDTGRGIMNKIRRETADHALRMTVLAPPPKKAKSTPDSSAESAKAAAERPKAQLGSRQHQPSTAPRPSAESDGARPAYRPPPRAANPLLAVRSKPSPLGRPRAGSPAAPSLEPRPKAPLERRPSSQKRATGAGVLMPTSKRKKP